MSFAANMYLYLAEGIIICTTNSMLMWCIVSDQRNRRRREFILVGAQGIADLFYAIAFMMIANLRLGLFFENKLTKTVPTNECAFIPALWLHNIATPLLGLLPMTTSFNFLLCSVAPLWYMRAGHLYTFILLLIPFTTTLILVVVNAILLIDVKIPISALCIAANGAAHHVAYNVMLFFRIVANLASALIYAFILIYLKKNHGGSLKELSPQQLKMHRNAKITLGLVTTNSMVLLFAPDVLLFLNPFNITKFYSTPLYSMTLSKTMINFVIYMWRYRELRNIILSRLFTCLPSHLNVHFQKYLMSTQEASMAPRSAFQTRSSIQQEKISIANRRTSIAPGSINPRLPRPMDPIEEFERRPGRLPPIRLPR
ncbi:unnamed protein product [Caenorhabditis bovis]|uniref:G-protein coupled receptors family 1 profile domain-containing protein n=1 Tax=Caenorhabditis bovis TaxID=2654633 RepID=A0A8S1EVR2_9PELO|nr:unnamed protein product [Caenorhabditis bovis]